MLYSYLLTRTDFKLILEPTSASADNKFAFAVYNDLLLTLLELTGHTTKAGSRRSLLDLDKKLLKSKVGAALAGEDALKKYILDNSTDIDVLRPALQPLADLVAASTVYKDFRRRRSATLADEVSLWLTLLETVVTRNEGYMKALRSVDGFSTVGFETGVKMFIQTLMSYRDSVDGYQAALNNLTRSLDQAYDLYVSCFALIIELTREQRRRLEQAKSKFLASAEDRNPNTRFVDNAFVAELEKNQQIETFMSKGVVSWETDITLINSLLKAITASKIYRDYMEAPATDYATDCEFWRDVMRTVVFTSDDFLEALEDKSVFWNDDLQIMGTFVLKTIRQSSNTPPEGDSAASTVVLLDKFKDQEDAEFGARLFVDAVRHREEYRQLIDRFVDSDSWDPERIAFMDIVIMIVAITELVEFPNIPLAVTMNEYVDIANDYSAPKSGQFVNGVLFNVVNALRADGKILK